ncbi:acetylglutamate kinase [Salinigranum rubrum]|uniref:Isopentenyl phosphate kinase n=1 Tax=Salinigranum rubrum TaxID=755307 RepID=A0A2I8VKD8_9EURY|nr:isopentenyl phosphate kinase [Salinigranum rubrum]AUV82365.1 acetylglutamate kinase [Salinigranum rubrum]
MTTVLKLGGSVVTEKDNPEQVDEVSLARTTDAVAGSEVERLVVVHGGGSFGHYHAATHGVTTTQGTHDSGAVADVHGAMKTLNRRVVDALLARDVPAVPVHPLSLGARDAEGDLTLPAGSVRTLLDEGFVPVLHGDLVAHRGKGTTVVSGDELVTSLAGSLDAERVGMCSTVPGVLDAEGEVIPHIGAFEDAAAALGGSDATDVTGGMAAKVRSLLSLGAPAFVFGPDGLGAFLAGEEAGTRIDGAGTDEDESADGE